MTDKDIDKLIDSFTSGDISDEDQRQLISRIKTDDTPDIPDELELRLSDTIDSLAEADRLCSAIRHDRHRHPRIRLILSSAASLAVLISLGVHFLSALRQPEPPTPLDTFATPEEAYPEVEKALLLFSSTIGKGMLQIEMVETTTADITNKVTAQINNTILNDNRKI